MSNNINNDLVTPIIVTYNSASHIKRLLASLEKLKAMIKEVIIIENNSLERIQTLLIIKQYREKSLLKIKVIENKINIGFGKACNICARKAKSKYILFINPDTEILGDGIKILIHDMESNKAIAAGGKCIKENKEIHRTVVRYPNLISGIFEFTNLGKIFRTSIGEKLFYYDKNIYNDNLDKIVDAVSGAFMLVNTAIFNQLNGFDPSYFMYLEDVDFGYRATKAGFQIIFCPHAVAVHIGGASSNNRDRILHSAWFNARNTYFYKNCDIFTNIILQPLFTIEEFIIKLKLMYAH